MRSSYVAGFVDSHGGSYSNPQNDWKLQTTSINKPAGHQESTLPKGVLRGNIFCAGTLGTAILWLRLWQVELGGRGRLARPSQENGIRIHFQISLSFIGILF